MKDLVNVAGEKKVCVCGEVFQDMGLGEIQVLIDTPEELTKDDLTDMHAGEPAPDAEKDVAVPENKLILDNLAEEF